MELFEVTQMCIVKNKNKVLILKFSSGSKKWSLPGGHLEKGENLKTGIKREVYEETGLSITNSEIFRTETTDNKLIIVQIAESPNKKIILSEEHSDYKWVDSNEVDKYEFPYEEIKNIVKEVLEENDKSRI